MAPYNYDDREVTYEIVEEIGVLAEQSTGWRKELNVVSWNGGQAKYDIRDWSPNHTQMGKGLTLNEREMRTIIDLLKRRARSVPRKFYSDQSEPGNDRMYEQQAESHDGRDALSRAGAAVAEASATEAYDPPEEECDIPEEEYDALDEGEEEDEEDFA